MGDDEGEAKGTFLVVEASEAEKKDGEDTETSPQKTNKRVNFTDYLRNLQHMKVVYSGYDREEVIGQWVFQHQLHEELKDSVLHSQSLKEALQKFQLMNPSLSHKQAEERARSILAEMVCEYKESVLRPTALIIDKVIRRLYQTIHVSEDQLMQLRKAAQEAQEKHLPLVFFPTHKSHIDYLVLSWVFFQCNISLPFIASGENLNFPLVGWILRHCGAFFIRRQSDNDPLYRAIFNEYINAILERGCNLEFFIEGGRSRTGKVLAPKMGLLSVLVSSILDKKVQDAVVVPISIAYDKVLETESYVEELLGKAKQKESLFSLMKFMNTLKFNFGNIDIRIAKPYLMTSFLESEISRRNLPTPLSPEHRRLVTTTLAHNILYEINMVSVALPTSLVVTVLLTHSGRGITRDEMVKKVDWLVAEIVRRGGHVASFKSTSLLVDKAIIVLGNLIGRPKKLLEAVYTPNKRFELSYYRNQIIHLFVPEGLVALAMYSNTARKKNFTGGGLTSMSVGTDVLLEDVKTLSYLFKSEFIYKAGPDISENFQKALGQMIDRKILVYTQGGEGVNDGSRKVEISSDASGQEQFSFLCFLFWPFIENYWMAIAGLYSLLPNKLAEFDSLLSSIQRFGLTLYYAGELNFYESISKDTLRHALDRFTDMKVITKKPIDPLGRVGVVQLDPPYDQEEKLRQLVELIGKFRRFSKYSLQTLPMSPKIRSLADLARASIQLSKL